MCQWWWSHTDVATTLPVSDMFGKMHSYLCSALLFYRSEGPAQVFLLILTWLISAFGHQTRDKWKQIILAYDNMCHVDNLRVAKKDLPLPGIHSL